MHVNQSTNRHLSLTAQIGPVSTIIVLTYFFDLRCGHALEGKKMVPVMFLIALWYFSQTVQTPYLSLFNWWRKNDPTPYFDPFWKICLNGMAYQSSTDAVTAMVLML